MALGYCPTCDRLVAITPGSQKWGTRERTWHTTEHERPDGTRCNNRKTL